MKWRNNEGREFHPDDTGWCHEYGASLCPELMCKLGYQLVDDSGLAVSEGAKITWEDESKRLREAQRKAWYEGWKSGYTDSGSSLSPTPCPYDTLAEPEGFEVEYDPGSSGAQSSFDVRIIPGNSYWVREVVG